MVDITPLVSEGRKLVTSYGDGLFRFGEESVQGSVLLFPEKVLSWPHTSLETIDLGAFDAFLESASEIDILLFGMGERMKPVRSEIRAGLRQHGIVVEPMDTGAACRTFNVLLAEGRRVAAAMIAV
jgi:uncharacterized protein